MTTITPNNENTVLVAPFDLRDYFAGQALPAVISVTSAGQHHVAGIDRGDTIPVAIALDAYEIADAMLAARTRQMDLTVGRANNG